MQIDKTREIVTLLKRTLRRYCTSSAKTTVTNYAPRAYARNGNHSKVSLSIYSTIIFKILSDEIRKYLNAIEEVQRDLILCRLSAIGERNV